MLCAGSMTPIRGLFGNPLGVTSAHSVFPKCTGKRMPVECQSEFADRIVVRVPTLGLLIFGQEDPCVVSLQQRLCVGLLSIALLLAVSGESADDVDKLSGHHEASRAC